MADEIATALSYVQSFSIRPSATTGKYSGSNVDLQQAARDMGVASIVTGHFLKEGDQLEITLEAVDTASNRSLWRDTINAAASDRIAMREQITSRVRQGLVPALGGASAAAEAGTRPKSEEAYDLYLRSIAVPHDVAPNKDAITMLERAAGIDPSYAPAWEALGLRYYYDGTYGDGGQEMIKRSDSASERALALDPNLMFAAAQLISIRTERGDVGNAYAEASALVKKRPESALAHCTLGYVLRYAGLLGQSAHECETALASDRGNYLFRSCAWVFIELNQQQKQWSLFASMRVRNGPLAANIFLREGKLAEARQSIQKAANPLGSRDLLQACIDPSHSPALERIAQKAEAAALRDSDSESRYEIGSLLAYCGRNDSALRLLKNAIEKNYCAYTALQTDPLLVKLHGSPEFRELLSAAKACQNRFLAQRDMISR